MQVHGMIATPDRPDRKSPVRRIYVCQPQYGPGNAASHRQFWRNCAKKYTSTIHCDGGCSLLANAFNKHWVHALTLQASGEDITHFAMLHDDIVPQDNWLDVLIDEQLATGADVVSAVVAIKDWMGLTSTAIAGPDEFTVLRRITMHEVYNLPETFGAEDCGYPEGSLRVNTGCWVCDFTKPWRHATDEHNNLLVYFTIRDRVTRMVTPDGQPVFQAEVAPEDWNFSRMVQALGGRVMATRKVHCDHYGQLAFTNGEPWGACEYDRILTARHGGKQISKPGYEYADQTVDVSGWLTDEEGRGLAALAKGRRVLEIGSYCGRSTIWMARTASEVCAVDPFDGRGTAQPRDTLEEFKENLARYKVNGNVRIYKGTSREAAGELFGKFDMVFIDGAHHAAAVREDVEVTAPFLTAEGLMVFHDYSGPDNPGVTATVNNLLRDGWDLVTQFGSAIALKRSRALANQERGKGNIQFKPAPPAGPSLVENNHPSYGGVQPFPSGASNGERDQAAAGDPGDEDAAAGIRQTIGGGIV